MTDAVKALIGKCRRDIESLRDLAESDDKEKWQLESDVLEAYVKAVEADSARDEAVEHAIARLALEAVREAPKTRLFTGCDTVYGRLPTLRADSDLMRDEIDHQLSLLGARNFEVVEIPQGETCGECWFNDDEENEACGNWKAPLTGRDAFRQKAGECSAWCRQKYGVEKKARKG